METFRPVDPTQPQGRALARSFSGHERNRLFMQSNENFQDVSLVSGADDQNDGRGFVLFDYDRDGRLDMGITSPLSPRFRVLRNRMGDSTPDRLPGAVFVNLVGGNHTSQRQLNWSARDGVGARVYATVGNRTRVFQKSCGEGFATQNSQWIHIGMGTAERIDRIKVKWPSGKSTSYQDIDVGSRVTLYEDGRIVHE